jgi:GTP-binding protein HflX
LYNNNTNESQTAVLVAANTGEYDVDVSLDELAELAETAGATVIAKFTQNLKKLSSATFVGAGKLDEIKQFCINSEAELIIFDSELSATQIKNIEKYTERTIIDRTMLILDIFAQRALTREGKLQVELAQQKYILPRLMGLGTALSRLGGGIGTRGPGESKLETDRRHIRRRIENLTEQLIELEKHRNFVRNRRKKDDVITVAIVGYTNVGKSTLLNALTNADVMAEDKLFATLDLTSRALELPDGREVILIDTVGFIRRLPHHLVEAFKSTLEEAVSADAILNICDASSNEAQIQIDVTEKLLVELGVENTPIIRVYNKCDKLEHQFFALNDHSVTISAKTGFGLDVLLNMIAKNLPAGQQRMTLKIPYDKGFLISQIRELGKILSENFLEDGLVIDALVDEKIIHKVREYRE